MLGGRRIGRWRRDAAPLVELLHEALVDLIADIGEPGDVVLEACAGLDRRITELDRWLVGHPCPGPWTEQSVRDLLGACAGLWATTVRVARRTPAGIDAGAGHLPASCASEMSARVDALETALAGARRTGLL
jgi:hypothetical protein